MQQDFLIIKPLFKNYLQTKWGLIVVAQGSPLKKMPHPECVYMNQDDCQSHWIIYLHMEMPDEKGIFPLSFGAIIEQWVIKNEGWGRKN